MKKSKIVLGLLVLSCLLSSLLAGCSKPPAETKVTEAEVSESAQATETKAIEAEAQPADGMRTILDGDGQEVEIPNEVKTCVVVGIYPLPAAIANYLGSGEKIIGMDAFAKAAAEHGLLGKLYPEILKAKTDFMDGEELNIESLLALKPDVVFHSAENDKVREMLKNAGIPAIGVHARKHEYNCIETYNDWFELLHRVFPGEGPDSSEVTAYSQKVYDQIQDRIKDIPEDERVRALSIFRYADDKLLVSGKSFFGNWWITSTGGINVASDVEANGPQPVNMEQVLSWNPEVIFITNFSGAMPEDLYSNAIGGDDWSTISAVQNQRVYKMPLASYRTFTPGVDTPVTMLWTAKQLYPEQFSDVDIAQEFKNYYKEMFNVELSDEDVAAILNPPREAAGKHK